jgi:hypothetical protein
VASRSASACSTGSSSDAGARFWGDIWMGVNQMSPRNGTVGPRPPSGG